MITAKVVADSLDQHGDRITTMEVVFPRFILAELNTHRMFSRNSASSRAIPFEKTVKMVQENPFIPIAWQKDHKGMQGTEYITSPNDINSCIATWKQARDKAVHFAQELNYQGVEGRDTQAVTKQLCNRLLEPFMWHKMLITATEWDNFWELRCPQYQGYQNRTYFSKKDMRSNNPQYTEGWTDIDWLKANKGQAEIHMMALAEAMWDAYNESTPKQLKAGEWHIPYGDSITDWDQLLNITVRRAEGVQMYGKDVLYQVKDAKMYPVKIATARCARVSYTIVGEEDKPANYANDIKLHDRLLESQHMSPFEHCARAMSGEEYSTMIKGQISYEEENGHYITNEQALSVQGWFRNFRGFIQYRAMIEGGKL